MACAPSIDYFDPGPSPYGQYSQAGVSYLQEIGFCPEFRTCDDPSIKKWTSDISVKIQGNYTKSDEAELDSIISELSELTGLSIKKTKGKADINIHFVSQNQFQKYIPKYNTYNPQDGIFVIYGSDHDNYIYEKATICIGDNFSDQKKQHLLREELTQSLGLPQDSYKYPNSVFQQDPRYKPTEYAKIDKEVIKILYDKRVKPGMTKQEVISVLTTQQPAQKVAERTNN